jgi:hypothetical protein
VKPLGSLELGFRFQVSGVSAAAGLKSGQFNQKRNFALIQRSMFDVQSVHCSGHVKFHMRNPQVLKPET